MSIETMRRIQLESHVVQMKAHQEKAMEQLKLIYPIGSRIAFKIMSGQSSMSSGSVAAHCFRDGIPTLRVLHEQAKPGSRYKYRDVLYRDVCGTLPDAALTPDLDRA